MNLIEFLKEVDNFSDNSSRDRLKLALHNLARKVPEDQRQALLDIILDDSSSILENPVSPELLKELKHIKAQLEEIRIVDNDLLEEDFDFDYDEDFFDENYYFEEEVNEEYDDWYHGPGEEFYYKDPFNIEATVNTAADLINQLYDLAEYKKCFELAQELFKIECEVKSDYDPRNVDFDEITNIIKCKFSLREIILKAAYSAYQSVPKQDKAKAVLDILRVIDLPRYDLQDLFQFDSELPNIDEFLDDCINELINFDTHHDELLLKEAIELSNNKELEKKVALANIDKDPELILNLLKNDKSISIKNKIDEGLNILQTMNKNYVVRGKLALYIAECIISSGYKTNKLNYCYLESFRSDSTVTNFLRFLLNSSEPKKKLINEAKLIIKKASNFKYSRRMLHFSKVEPELNDIFSSTKNLLNFLTGQFEEVLDEYIKTDFSYSYGNNDLNALISLYCFLLYDIHDIPGVFIDQLTVIKKAFNFKEQKYLEGLNKEEVPNLFLELLKEWKQLFPINNNLIERIKIDLDQLITDRVIVVMKNDQRKYYRECAEIIAEIGKANCATDPKFDYQAYLQKFIDMYPRRRNFVRDVNRYMYD